MEKSDSFPILVKNWRLFGTYLEVDTVELQILDRKLNMGQIQMGSIPRDVLDLWGAEKASAATWQVLSSALVRCGVNAIAESLEPLSVETLKFVLRNKVVTLEKLLGRKKAENVFETISINFKNVFNKKHMQLLKDELIPSKRPQNYIPRTLVCSTELDSKVFASESIKDHIFLFKGISRLELARTSNYQAIDESGNQLEKVTANFITLECDEDDFDTICKISGNPTHVIQHDNGRFFLVKSNKSLDVVHPFLKIEEEEIEEEVLIARIEFLAPPCILSIADSPGMGKTLISTNLAFEIQDKFPNYIVLYIVLQEFIHHISSWKNTSSSAIEAIATYSTTSDPAKLVVKEMLLSGLYKFYFFLDGYDEITKDKLALADLVLIQLSKLENVKLLITTRPHLRDRVETISNQLSLKLQPFNEDNQVLFLTQYWIKTCKAKEGVILEHFARQCLSALSMKLSDREKTIAGIPLQCKMLAEVFADSAKRASRLENLRQDVVKPISFFEMYKRLVDLKFKRIPDSELNLIKTYVNAHVFLVASLVFNYDNTVYFFWSKLVSNPFTQDIRQFENINEGTLYSIGLIEKNPHGNTCRFVHRTFAEYLLAEFVVKNLASDKECVDLFLAIIFGKNGTSLSDPGNFLSFQLNYPVVAYFIEMHVSNYRKRHSIGKLLPSEYSKFKLFTVEDVCATISACLCNNLENTFDLATIIIRTLYVSESLKQKYFHDLPRSIIKELNSVQILKKVLEFMKTEFKVSADFYTIKPIPSARDSYSRTLLHTAAHEGKYNIFTFLMTYYGNESHNYKFLLMDCVENSAEDSQSTIDDKLLIIDYLIKINPGSLNEKLESLDNTPLLAPKVHLSLLKSLVELGANINVCSPWRGTILHVHGNKSNYKELVRWAFSSGFDLVDYKTNGILGAGETPLMHAIEMFGAVDDDVLELFYEAGSNINAQDKLYGNSVLFYAIKYSTTMSLIRKLLEYGANVNHVNKYGENAAHILTRVSNDPSKQPLNKMKFLVSNGFSHKQLDKKDTEGKTPLDYAEKFKNHELVAFLKENITY